MGDMSPSDGARVDPQHKLAVGAVYIPAAQYTKASAAFVNGQQATAAAPRSSSEPSLQVAHWRGDFVFFDGDALIDDRLAIGR